MCGLLIMLGGLGACPQEIFDALRLNLRAFKSQNNCEITTGGEHVIIYLLSFPHNILVAGYYCST